jgi:hypothetical protein
MRALFLTFALLASGSPALAQLARVEVTARVRVPEFMFIERGPVTESTLENGQHVRRVTLLISANRSWRLEVARLCVNSCTTAQYRVSSNSGKPGNAQQVVIEYFWDANTAVPPPDEFQYLLVAG